MTLYSRFLYSHDRIALAGGLILSALILFSPAPVAAAETETKPETEKASADYYELMRVFVDTFQEIDRNYVKEVDRRKLVEAAVRGMLEELDPYSDYIAPDDLGTFTEAISQEFGGVGIRVNWDREQRSIEVVTPMPGSPAYKAGIKAGDRIVEIDGTQVKDFPNGKELDTAVEKLRGKPGEKVEIGVTHVGAKEVDKISLKRELIQLDTVLGNTADAEGKWNMMLDPESKIGYFRITHFTNRSTAEVREALKSLKKEGLKGLIIDLRYNPGGLLEAAVEISDLFIESGVIVSTDGRNSAHRSWSAKRFGTFTGFPVAILVNRYSASASEIVSACLQDHDRAIVVGERSWGKGSVQDVIDLEDGKSALKLTTASYHRPSGKNIHRFPDSKETDEWGVSPNEGYKVEFSFDDHRKYQEDRQMRDTIGKNLTNNFVDKQLEKAKEYILEQLAAPAEEKKAEEKPESDEEKKTEEKEAKASGPSSSLPLFIVPKMAAG
ncbi:MAG TPA: S41 family peptidase [Planctomicrobium sp.]|nr:S41 family peptidase [Planctomicrobium sp.]